MRTYNREMDGLPLVEATRAISIVLTEVEYENSVPRNAESCLVALSCKRQMGSPFVHITRTLGYITLPHEGGVSVPGRRGKWAMVRHNLPQKTREVVREVDLGLRDPEGIVINLEPMKPTQTWAWRKAYNESHPKRHTKEPSKRKNKDVLTRMGVRNYTGKSPY